MKRFVLIILSLFVAFLAACSSGVKLDPAPLEDRTPTTSTRPSAPPPAAPPESSIRSVDLSASAKDRSGPAGVERIVYFDYDSYTIKPEFQSLIDAHARFLKTNPSRKVNLEGNTDLRGGREYNLALGQKRAEAVRHALALLGVSDAQMEAVSFGMEKPIANGMDDAAHAKNRRTEISYQ